MVWAMSTEEWWLRAFAAIDDDGCTLEQAQSVWAKAVSREFTGEVSCAPGAFGPMAVGPGAGAGFRTKPWVTVTSATALGCVRAACDAAWNRFVLVDDNGDELTSDDMDGEIDPVGYPVRQGDVVHVGWDWHHYPDDPVPAKAATMLRVLAEELRGHGCVPAHIGDATTPDPGTP